MKIVLRSLFATALLAVALQASAADKRVTAMSSASTPGGTEVVYVIQGGVDKKITLAAIKTFASLSPTLVTPALGVATVTSINKVAITAPASGATLTIPDGVTLNAGVGGTLGALSFITPGTGVATWATTPSSANLAAALTDETGSGVAVFATSPTLVTPVLGVATVTSVNKITITAPATGATLTIPDGVTLNAGAGGTLGSNAFTSTAYAALASPQFSGKVGIGLAPTAFLHVPASTAAADTASIKIAPGVVATTPVSGNVESDGTHLYWTDSGGTRHQLDN